MNIQNLIWSFFQIDKDSRQQWGRGKTCAISSSIKI